MIEIITSVNIRKKMIKSLYSLSFLVVFSSASITAYATDPRELVVITPFPYAADKEFPQNVKMEMDLEEQAPELIVNYLKKKRAFKNITIASDLNEKKSDLYVVGEIVTIEAGNAGARYLSGFGSGGKSLVVLDIKIYDADRKLITQGEVSQSGSSGAFSMAKTFSNRANITSAIAVIGKSINSLIITGGLADKPDGVIGAINSFEPVALRTAAKTAATNRLYKDVTVTDAMAAALQKMLDASDEVNDSKLIDGLAWCAINLGSSENVKYIAILESVVESDVSRKIKKRAKKSLKYLNKINAG